MPLHSTRLLKLSRLLHWAAFLWFLGLEAFIWFLRFGNLNRLSEDMKIDIFKSLAANLIYFIGAWKCLRPATSTRMLILSGLVLSAVFSRTWLPVTLSFGASYDTAIALALLASWVAVIIARWLEAKKEVDLPVG